MTVHCLHACVLTLSCLLARRPKLIFVGPTGGPGMPAHLSLTPVLINISPTWEIMPPGADVPPILQDGGVGVDPTPGHLVVTPPVERARAPGTARPSPRSPLSARPARPENPET